MQKCRFCEFLWGLCIENWSFGRKVFLFLVNILLFCNASLVREK